MSMLTNFNQTQHNILMDSHSTPSPVNTVKITNVSLNVSKKDVKEFFSFSGDIQYIEMMQSETEETQVAYVTFKDPQGAETAMLLTGAVIADHRVSITPAMNYELPQEALALDSENSYNGFTIKKAEDVVNVMVERGYALGKDAVEKARAFDDRHNLISNASATIASFDSKIGLSEKLSVGTTLVNEKFREMDERYQVKEITKSALAAAEERAISAGTALMANPYVSTGASWLSNAFGAVTKAVKERAENGGEGGKEIIQLGDSYSPKDPAVVPVCSVDADLAKPSY